MARQPWHPYVPEHHDGSPITTAMALDPGSRVRVRTHFDGSWAQGFEVAEKTDEHHFTLRRLSDGTVLPVVFDSGELRPED